MVRELVACHGSNTQSTQSNSVFIKFFTFLQAQVVSAFPAHTGANTAFSLVVNTQVVLSLYPRYGFFLHHRTMQGCVKSSHVYLLLINMFHTESTPFLESVGIILGPADSWNDLTTKVQK